MLAKVAVDVVIDISSEKRLTLVLSLSNSYRLICCSYFVAIVCYRWSMRPEFGAPRLCLGCQVFGEWGHCDCMFRWSGSCLDST